MCCKTSYFDDEKSLNFPSSSLVLAKFLRLDKFMLNIQLKWKSSPYVNKRFVYILNCCIFLKYDVLSEYLTPFWFAVLLNE